MLSFSICFSRLVWSFYCLPQLVHDRTDTGDNLLPKMSIGWKVNAMGFSWWGKAAFLTTKVGGQCKSTIKKLRIEHIEWRSEIHQYDRDFLINLCSWLQSTEISMGIISWLLNPEASLGRLTHGFKHREASLFERQHRQINLLLYKIEVQCKKLLVKLWE